MARVTSWTKYTYLNALVSLIGGLTRDRHYSYTEIAALVGCSESQARKLADELADLTIPYLAGQGESILPLLIDEDGMTLHDSFSFDTQRSIRLDRMQTIAVILALRMMGISWDDASMRQFCDAITIDAPIEYLPHIIDISGMHYTDEVMEVLAQAALDGCCVEIVYRGEVRVIEPWLLLGEKEHYYEYGWCRQRGAPRMFRLDRISQATLLPAERASHSYEKEVSQAYPGLDEAPYIARLHFEDPHSYSESDWTGARTISSTRPGVLIELPYTSPDWITRQVVSYCGKVEVISPQSLREAVVEYATRIRALCGVGR
ncbi:MAG: WYL domain-containing protein [Actinomycetia bacterium]|nr:WYL domain-containing protein [Actinomycetes bacterium]